jgi:TrmH family RNA methyltransferase
MTTLTSRNNPKIKQIRQLINHRKERDATGLFVVEGIRHVGEALAANARVEYLCYAPDLLRSDFALQLIHEQSKIGTPCLAVAGDTFSSLAGKENPQGLIAVVQQPNLQLDGLLVQNFPFGVALVAPQDPGNIGSILRTIDAVGASGLLLLDDPAYNQYSSDAYHPSSVRASMGAIFWYPLVRASFSDFLRWEEDNSYNVYGTSAHARQDYRLVDRFTRPLILLMGSEREGLSATQSDVCDVMVNIPMKGRVTSLNLAIATGIMLYSILDKLE